MLIRREVLLCAMMACVCFPGVGKATTDCVQTFKLLGVSGGRASEPCVFWVAEDLAGECHQSRLIQVVVQKTQAGLIKSTLDRYQDWGWWREAVGLLEGPKGVALKKQGSFWQDPDVRIKLSAPAPNAALMAKYKEGVETWLGYALKWNERMGMDGKLCPSVEGMDVELLYAYSRGLYVNYSIKQAFYFPDRAMLFVQTEQAERAVGMDTMHGFLVLRVLPRTEGATD